MICAQEWSGGVEILDRSAESSKDIASHVTFLFIKPRSINPQFKARPGHHYRMSHLPDHMFCRFKCRIALCQVMFFNIQCLRMSLELSHVWLHGSNATCDKMLHTSHVTNLNILSIPTSERFPQKNVTWDQIRGRSSCQLSNQEIRLESTSQSRGGFFLPISTFIIRP